LHYVFILLHFYFVHISWHEKYSFYFFLRFHKQIISLFSLSRKENESYTCKNESDVPDCRQCNNLGPHGHTSQSRSSSIKKKTSFLTCGRSLAGWGKSSRMFHLEPIKYNVYTLKTRLSQSSAGVPGILLVFKYSPKKNQSASEPVYRVRCPNHSRAAAAL